MTYDFRVAEADPVAGHHANLYPSPADDRQRSADGAVRDFLAAGVPAGKLVLGVPFYGRAWVDVKPERNGLYQTGAAPKTRIDTAYHSLAADFVGRNGFVRFWDPDARSPYLWNAERRIFITYDDPESLGQKARYIREKGLAGAMFWQYANDRSGVLLEALHHGLRD
jgi:chitinase